MYFRTKTIIMAMALALVFGLMPVMGHAAPGDVVDDFELEGNIINDGVTDWDDLFDVSGDNEPTHKGTLPSGFGPAKFVRDFNPGKKGPDFSTYATGSKDTLDITPGWECTKSNNVGDKFDLLNTYATTYIDGDGDVILYFALERYSNEGTGNVGFWFLQDPTVGCAAGPGGSTPFTGNHVDGDLLIVSEFSQGGKVDTIQVYRWSEALGTLDPSPVIDSTDCTDPDPLDPHDPMACATVNKVLLLGYGPGTDIPWLTQTKTSGSGFSDDLDVSEFFEAGVNLTDLGLLACFTKYIAVTRSSTSLESTIHDYAIGDFRLCGIDVGKECRPGTSQNPNPVVDLDGESIITIFDVTIENTGIAPVFAVTLQEDFDFALGETCKITKINGSVINEDITDGEPFEVAAELAAKSQLAVELTCDTFVNGFANIVTAGAKSAASLTEPDLSKQFAMDPADICTVPISPALTVVKECADLNDNDTPDGVRLVKEGGQLVVEVVVDVELTNNGEEKLVGVTLSDNKVAAFTNVDVNGNPILGGFDGELLPDEKEYFRGSYKPSAPTVNGDGPFPTCASTQFQDIATATFTGAISGVTDTADDEATCALCLDCP